MTAMEHVERLARERREQAQAIIRNVQQMANIPAQEMLLAQRRLPQNARVALHFHPDRLDSRGLSVAAGLLQDGVYKSQFETHISNGQLSPELGGPRDHWENRVFGQAYKGTKLRPKYGALDLGLWPDGPSPRFGSCYLLTCPEVLQRSSFCYLDSYRNPKEWGTLKQFDEVFAALLSESFERHYALGRADFKPAQLVHHLSRQLSLDPSARFGGRASANLDHYIEVQVHGEVSLAEDVDYLVADPAFEGTETGELLQRLAAEYEMDLCWHGGFRLHLAQIPSDFRGPAMPSLARRVAMDDYLDARALGLAAQALQRNPQLWRDRGSRELVAQELKLLWHVLVKYGEPSIGERG
ncbi:DUF3626 domain-containing protein [Shewanella sp. AS16]|uniref:DUF3626 domain-containing protein n=1 Tax=Shewanella sp. AS16 TaxID=2907625 RepID=UPI001F3F224A|nr:DUF3626 domain-containing protein [Shewanella sp. AS16]MCE9685601.1 DUF3626 domain-containing protein [Shewanella sp. AS16]